jgi:hypothetical protein
MADQYTNADVLGLFLTGATSDGGSQPDPSLSFGNYRSSSEENQAGFFLNSSIRGVIIEKVAGANGVGLGSLQAVGGNSLRWTAPNDSPGEVVAIANNETKMLQSGGDASKYIIVSRHTASDLTGSATVNLVSVFNNAIGSSNVPDSEALVKLRCLAIKNVSSAVITNLKVWLGTLGTQRVSDAGQLGTSGAGTIETGGSFVNWPIAGFCRITTAAGTLREIVYYSSRTKTTLTVPAAGRGLLGTTAGAGASDDKLDAVPGIQIAQETPTNNHFTVASDEHDTNSVSGLTWSTGITAATGLNVDSLAAGSMVGIWLWLVVVSGRSASPQMENLLKWRFETGGSAFESNKAGGFYRIATHALERYELFRGENAEPDLMASPYETFTQLPHIADGGVSVTLYLILRHRNKYNLNSQNSKSWQIKLDANGAVVPPNPQAPRSISIVPSTDATGFVSAEYLYDVNDENAATDWLIYFTDNGVDPNPAQDTPTIISMQKANGKALLRWTSPAADNNDTLKVLVRTRLVSGEEHYDSQNTDIYFCVASNQGPAAPVGQAFLNAEID